MPGTRSNATFRRQSYQYVKQGHVLQFDGQQTKAVYALSDSLMRHNLVGKVPQQPQMERELKAIIQQYMDRMVNDRLTPVNCKP